MGIHIMHEQTCRHDDAQGAPAMCASQRRGGAALRLAAFAAALLAVAACTMAGPACAQQALAAEASPFASGSGTAADPYVVANADQLRAFRDAVNEGSTYEGQHVTLSADVDVSGAQWVPIGASTRLSSGVTSDSTPFKGAFDGAGHTISGLSITPTSSDPAGPDYAWGLFGAVMGGTVSNVALAGVDVDAPDSELAGAAVGLLGEGGSVSSVTVSGSVRAKCGVGGIVGRMTANGTVSDCTNEASVEATGGTGNCGGIVGAAYYTPEGSYMSIDGCTNKGSVTGVNDTGGIAGLCCAFVSGCTNEGAVSGSGYAVGGIAGEMKNYGGVTHCTNKADVANPATSAPYGTGGIVGWVRYDGAPPAYALSEPIDVADNANLASVSAATGVGVGGIVGVLYSAGTVTGNENHAPALSGKQFIGGIVGDLQDQGASTLPSSVKEGALVENNVSTTPLASMSGALSDLYAYNNDASIFSVSDNSAAWEAVDASTGDVRYATVEEAFSRASAGDTVTLVANAKDVGTLEAQPGRDVTIDLDGHDIAFAPGGCIAAKGDTVTVVGSGDVYALDDKGSIAPAPTLFEELAGEGGAPGKVVLKGGTYPFDVEAYVAPGFESRALAQPNGHENRFEVVPADGGGEAGSGGPASAGDGSQASVPKQGVPLAADEPASASYAMAPAGDDAGWGAFWAVLALLCAGSAATVAACMRQRIETEGHTK